MLYIFIQSLIQWLAAWTARMIDPQTDRHRETGAWIFNTMGLQE